MPLEIPVRLVIDEQALREVLETINVPYSSGGQPEEVPPFRDAEVELPVNWRQIDQASGVEYTWGEDTDVYDPFTTYEGKTSRGKSRLAIGKCHRTRAWGMDRVYYIVVAIGPAGGMRAISEFLAADDYDETGDVIAIIRGKDGSARLFDRPGDLPAVYGPWETVTYRDRVDYPGSYLKQALICSEHDHATMLNHSLAQIQLRELE